MKGRVFFAIRKIAMLSILALTAAGCAELFFTQGDPSYNYLEVVPGKIALYPNEQNLLTYRLYTRADIRYEGLEKQGRFKNHWIEHFKPISNNVRTETVTRGGLRFVTVEIHKVALFPMKSGLYTLDPGTAKTTYFRPLKREREVAYLSATPITVTVEDFPKEGRPADFTGFTGKFEMKSEARVINEQGGFVELAVTLEGAGNIRHLQLPEQDFGRDWESAGVEEKANVQWEGNQITGSKTFQYKLIPRRKGTLTVPPVSFSYFDSEGLAYKTLTSKERSVEIREPWIKPFKGLGLEGSDKDRLIFLIDVSGSMWAMDVELKDRLSIAKKAITEILARKQDALVGLKVFAREVGTIRSLSPVGPDILDTVGKIKVGMLGEDGTATGSAIYEAVKELNGTTVGKGRRAIILLSDGTYNGGYVDPFTAAGISRESSVPIFFIVLGRGGLVSYRVDDPDFGPKVLDQVDVEVDEVAAREIVGLSGGQVFRIQNEQELSNAVNKILEFAFS